MDAGMWAGIVALVAVAAVCGVIADALSRRPWRRKTLEAAMTGAGQGPEAQAVEVRNACYALIAQSLRKGSVVEQYDLADVRVESVSVGAWEIRVTALDLPGG